MSKEIKSTSSVPTKGSQHLGRFLNPEKIVSSLEILPDMKVAHFGCGTGFFTFPIARKIGTNGTIYALDVLDEKTEAIKSQAKMLGLGNVIAKRVNLEKKEGSGLPDASVDWVILANMLYQNDHKSRVILEAKRVLKKDGRILVIDWESEESSIGPEKISRVSKQDLIKIARKNEMGILKELEVSNFHFGMVLVK